MISKEDADRLVELSGQIQNDVEEVSNLLRRMNSHEYERWKAYGKQVTNDFLVPSTLPDIADKYRNFENEEEPEDESDRECDYGDTDCNRPNGHSTEEK